MTEASRWLPVPGYEGIYEISDHGDVRSVARKISGRDGRTWDLTGGPRATFPDAKGYPRVVLCRDDRGKTFKVHRLVLEAFVGPCPPGMEACHADDNPRNLNIANLRWDTKSANQLDKVRNGGHPQAKKTSCLRGHLLIDPNLLPGQLRRGWRNCRACECERKLARKWGRAFDPAAADRKYRSLMDA